MPTIKPRQHDLVPPKFVQEAYLDALPNPLAEPVRLLFALRASVQRINADLTRWLGADALSPGRMQMLTLLWASPTPVAQRELVRALGVSRASVSELVDALKREGLISTRDDPTDRRKVLIALTADGRSTANRQIYDNATRLRGTFAALNDEDLVRLSNLLGRLCA